MAAVWLGFSPKVTRVPSLEITVPAGFPSLPLAMVGKFCVTSVNASFCEFSIGFHLKFLPQ